MKKYISYISLVLIVYSCTIRNVDQLNIPDKYNQIGVYQNEGFEVAFDSIRNFYKENYRGDSILQKLSKEEILVLQKKVLSNYLEKKSLDLDSIKSSLINADTLTLNVAQINVFQDKIKHILQKNPRNQEKLLMELNEISKEVSEKLTEPESSVIYMAISTTYYSYIYWKENYIKWQVAINEPQYLLKYSDEDLNRFRLIGDKYISTK